MSSTFPPKYDAHGHRIESSFEGNLFHGGINQMKPSFCSAAVLDQLTGIDQLEHDEIDSCAIANVREDGFDLEWQDCALPLFHWTAGLMDN